MDEVFKVSTSLKWGLEPGEIQPDPFYVLADDIYQAGDTVKEYCEIYHAEIIEIKFICKIGLGARNYGQLQILHLQGMLDAQVAYATECEERIDVLKKENEALVKG